MKSVSLPSRFYVLFCVTIFGTQVSESATSLTMINNCKATIWPGVSPGRQSFDGGGFELKPKEAREFTAPATWTGRIWGRTGCKFDLQGQGKCETGSCGDSIKCTGNGNPPATLVEFSFGQFQGLDYYDVSLVDGFNVPLAITPIDPKGSCSVTGCREDLTTTCPPELALDVNGDIVACQSACLVFNTSQYCCTGNFSTSETCVQTNYSNIFKEACPAAYTTAYDDKGTTFTCSGADYAITFCSSRLDLYNTLPSPLPAPTRPPKAAIPPAIFSESGRRRNSVARVIIAVFYSIISVFLFVAVSTFLFLRKKPNGFAEAAGDDIMTVESLRFDFATIRAATNDFSKDNKLGQGGFGVVYKGRLSNGEAIAVKRLSKESTQGELEFKNEVLLLARLEHKNLVRLLGFSLERHERLLVYELIKNSSLDKYLFDPTIGRVLDWEKRYNIITGIARGLLYLHEDSRLRIIHRDLKASNILLDDRMNPKIADFGLARLFAEDQTQQDTNRIVGTFGYMPPEYVGRGQFSMKSDVFSFGVLVLEIISGQKISTFRNEEGDSLLTYAWKNWNESRAANLIDYRLRDCWGSEMMRCIHMGLLCVQENAKDRPNMASIVQMLGNQSISRHAPSKPAFSSNNTLQPDNKNHHFAPSSSSVNKVSISELCPR